MGPAPQARDLDGLREERGASSLGGIALSIVSRCRSFVFEQLGEEETYDIFYASFVAERNATVAEAGLNEALCRNELLQCSGQEGESEVVEMIRGRAFLERLATKHGVSPETYVAPRSEAEWEKALLGGGGEVQAEVDQGRRNRGPEVRWVRASHTVRARTWTLSAIVEAKDVGRRSCQVQPLGMR